METKELERLIKSYNEAYRKGDPLISDEEYDLLVDQLYEKDPKNDLFKKSIIEEPVEDSRKEELPYPMFSLEKIKEVKELKKFIKETWKLKPTDKIVITPKYDGISLLVEEGHHAWTRGNGSVGQNSDGHYKKIKNGSEKGDGKWFQFTYGEAIFKTTTWLDVKRGTEYKSARNTVAGLFNSGDASNLLLPSVTYVRYGSSRSDLDKTTQLFEMNELYKNVTPWWTTFPATFDNDDETVRNWLNAIFEQCVEYKCDGLVIEVDKAEIRNELGRLPNNNPRYAIAYKDPEWSERAETKVLGIEWNISKDGKAKPVLLIEPVELCGATVQRASGYNAAYIYDNRICEGSKVVIARSGDVIPKHIKTLSYDSQKYFETVDDMMICPSCGEPLRWDNTQTELICLNSLCEQRQVANLVYFFSTIGTEEFREPTIFKFYAAGYRTIDSILNLSKTAMQKIEGVGESLAKKLTSQFAEYRQNGLPLARLMVAYNVFGGVIAEKKCQSIFDNLSEEDLEKVGDLSEIDLQHLIQIEGIGEITAKIFNQGILKYANIIADDIRVSYIKSPQKKVAENQMNVCFTGFRNKDWENRLLQAGHKIASGVTSKTTHLVVKDLSSGSSKKVKANSLQIPIYTMEEFEKFLEVNNI